MIGPNGSGKSNLLDALSFVLGLRLDKDKSRAAVLTDLLHKKQDQTLEDVRREGRGQAYVELVFMSADGRQNAHRDGREQRVARAPNSRLTRCIALHLSVYLCTHRRQVWRLISVAQ